MEIESFAGFNEGAIRYSGIRHSISNTIVGVNKNNLNVLFTIRNARFFNGKPNQSVLTLVGVSGSLKHGQPATLQLYKSNEDIVHTLGGNPNFQFYGDSTSILLDTTATTFTPIARSQLMWSGEIGETGQVFQLFSNQMEKIVLAPGESLSLVATTRAGTAQWTAGSLDLREDY